MACTYILQGFVLVTVGQYICLSFGAEINSNATDTGHCDIKNMTELLKRIYEESESQWAVLPAHKRNKIVSAKDIKYYLYTKRKKEPFIIENGDVTMLKSKESNFDQKNLNVFIIHGWNNDYNSLVNKKIKKATLKTRNANVFVVDWSKHANDDYYVRDPLNFACRMKFSVNAGLYNMLSRGASLSSIKVAAFVGRFIAAMMKQLKVKGKQFILIGHSLGAHISGIAGYTVHKTIRKYVKVVVGLDPPTYNFFMCRPGDCIDKTDAEIVQVIYSSVLSAGDKKHGHANFHPNGVNIQPACSEVGILEVIMCEHRMSYLYYAESIKSDEFVAYRCDSLSNYDAGECFNNHRTRMGGIEVDTSAKGAYYLRTNKESPYALGDRAARSSSSLSTVSIINIVSNGIVKYFGGDHDPKDINGDLSLIDRICLKYRLFHAKSTKIF